MTVKRNKMWVATLSLAAMGFIAVPTVSYAQDDPVGGDSGLSNKVVSLDLEGVDLYQALTLLFKQAKAQYTLDNSLRGTLITVHIKQPFKAALETVLKTSGLPITYQYQDNVYSVIPIKPTEELTPDGTDDPETKVTPRARISRSFGSNLSGETLIAFLGGRTVNFVGGFSSIMMNPFGGGGMGGGGGFGGRGF